MKVRYRLQQFAEGKADAAQERVAEISREVVELLKQENERANNLWLR